jgi:hypothetical protein
MATKKKTLPDWAYDYVSAAVIGLKDSSDLLKRYIVKSKKQLSDEDLVELMGIKEGIDSARAPFSLLQEHTDGTSKS